MNNEELSPQAEEAPHPSSVSPHEGHEEPGELIGALLAARGSDLLDEPFGEVSPADMELVAAHAEGRLGGAARRELMLRFESEPALADALADHLLLLRETDVQAAPGVAAAPVATPAAARQPAVAVPADAAPHGAGLFGGLAAAACVGMFAYGLTHLEPTRLETALGISGMLLGMLYIIHGVTRIIGRTGTVASFCVAFSIGGLSQADTEFQLMALSIAGMLLGIMYVALGATLAPIRAEAARRSN